MTLHPAFLLLGSNLSDPASQLKHAIQQLSQEAEVIIQSSVYRSEPWGIHNQPEFLNQVVLIQTQQSPEELLKTTQRIEANLGRVRKEKWGPRPIDIDILFYEDRILSSETLTIPHPQLQNRKFTLLPLAEIAPTLVHPLLLKSITQLLGECTDELNVIKVE